jgi:hypothetical protein
MSYRTVIGVDVGYSSLGLVCASVAPDFDKVTVEHAEKIDLRDIPCPETCTLQHSGNVVDRMSHFVQHYEHWLNNANLILIEAQPIGGLRDVQALLYAAYRRKCSLISPVSMHKHFGLSSVYEERKEETVQIATSHLGHLHNFRVANRKHDMADAFCMVLFWTQQQEKLNKKYRPLSKEAVSLDRFRFVKRDEQNTR